MAETSAAATGAVALVVVAAFYSFLLCVINTRVTTLSGSAPLIATEGAICVAGILLLVNRATPTGLVVVLAIAFNFCVLSVLRESIDAKALRDVLMIVVFTWLGFAYARPAVAERLLFVTASIVVAIGLLELVFPTVYATLADPLRFYAARGVTTNKYALLTLLERPTGIGRSILPFLGPRRISSIFLEPVSMGNFAVIVGAWVLAKDGGATKRNVALFLLAVAAVILADARFGALALAIMVASRTVGLWKFTWLHAVLPPLGMASTAVIATVRDGTQWSDDFAGRMLGAGRHLLSLDASAWLGVPQDIMLDAGYGYVIQQFGIVLCIGLWIVYALLPMGDRGKRFRFNLSLYIALILCVSGSSLFALKTAAIAFFLLGSLVIHEARERRRDADDGAPAPGYRVGLA